MNSYKEGIISTIEALSEADGSNENDIKIQMQTSASETQIRWNDRAFHNALKELVVEGRIVSEDNGKYTVKNDDDSTEEHSIGEDTEWTKKFNELKDFVEKDGNIDEIEDSSSLNQWVTRQRAQLVGLHSKSFSRLTESQASALERLGIRVETAQPDDNDVKPTAKTVQFSDGVHDAQDSDMIDNDKLNLVTGSPLLEPRYFPWENDLCHSKENQATWDERFEDLVKYKEKYGNCRVPKKMKILGGWVQRQRREYRQCKDGQPTNLTRERYMRLKEVGFLFWTKGIKSIHLANSPARIAAPIYDSIDSAEVEELKRLVNEQNRVIEEQQFLMNCMKKQVDELIDWKEQKEKKTKELQESFDLLQTVVENQERKISDLEEAKEASSPEEMGKRVEALENWRKKRLEAAIAAAKKKKSLKASSSHSKSTKNSKSSGSSSSTTKTLNSSSAPKAAVAKSSEKVTSPEKKKPSVKTGDKSLTSNTSKTTKKDKATEKKRSHESISNVTSPKMLPKPSHNLMAESESGDDKRMKADDADKN